MDNITPSPQTTLGILLGASEWPHAKLASSPAFANSASRVREYFLNSDRFGIRPENWLDLFDTQLSSPNEIDQAIGIFLQERTSRMKQAGTPARDLLFYYIGHGMLAFGPHQAYYLAIHSTDDKRMRSSAIAMAALADTLKTNARHLRRIVILDCCFAAESSSYMMQAEQEQTIQKQTISAFEEKSIGNGFPQKGTALFCSSGQKEASLLLQDESGTMFSEALILALAQGNAHQREKTHLSLYDLRSVMESVLEDIAQGNAPRPFLHSPDQSEGDIAAIPFFPNARAEEGDMSELLLAREAEAEERRVYAQLKAQELKAQARKAAEEKLAREAEEERINQEKERKQESSRKWFDDGNHLFSLKKYDEALAAYEQAILINPEYHKAYAEKAKVLENLERYEEALAIYEQRGWSVSRDKAWVLYKLERYKEALDTINEYLINNHYSPEPFYTKSQILVPLKRYKEALEAINASIIWAEREPIFLPWAYYQKGRILMDLKQYAEALTAYRTVIRLRSSYDGSAELHHDISVALKNLNRPKEAKLEEQRARELGYKPESRPFWRNMLKPK